MTASEARSNAESVYAEAKARSKAAEAGLADARRRTEDLQRETRKVEIAREREAATQAEASKRLNRVKRELSALAERGKTMEGAISEYGGLVGDQKRRIGVMRNQLADLQRSAEEHKRAEKDATDQVSTLRRHAREQAGAADAAQSQVQHAQGELDRERERLASCKEEEDDLRRAVADAAAAKERSVEEVAALQAEKEELRAKTHAAAEEAAALRKALGRARAEAARLQRERDTARAGATAAAEEAAALRRQAEEARKEAAAQARKGADAHAALTAATSARDKAAAAAADAEGQLRRADEARAADETRLEKARQALVAVWSSGGNDKEVARVENLTKVAQALEARRHELERQGTCSPSGRIAAAHSPLPAAPLPAWNVARLGALQRAMALLAKAGSRASRSTLVEGGADDLRHASKLVRPGGGAPSPEADAAFSLGARQSRRRRAERVHAEASNRRKKRRPLSRQPRPSPRPTFHESTHDADELDLFADM